MTHPPIAKNRARTWLNQFGDDYDVPKIITDALIDTSWGNDMCPSFARCYGSGWHR